MKVSVEEKGFQPFTLKLKIESKEEAEKLFAVFNHTDIVDFMGGDTGPELIRDILEENTPNFSYEVEFIRFKKAIRKNVG